MGENCGAAEGFMYDDLQYGFQQCNISIEGCIDLEGECNEGDNNELVIL